MPLGEPLPPRERTPHAAIEPSALSAANANLFEKMAVKPVPLGAPLPPLPPLPHAAIEPSALSAANAYTFEKGGGLEGGGEDGEDGEDGEGVD